MYVGENGIRKIIVDNYIHIFEVNSSCNQVSCDQNPESPCIKFFDDSLSLFFAFFSSEYLNLIADVQSSFEHLFQLKVELFSPLFFLNKNQNRRDKSSLRYHISDLYQLSILICTVFKRLVYFLQHFILTTYFNPHTIIQKLCFQEFFNGMLYSCWK